MDPIHSVRDVFTPDLIIIAHLFAVVIAVLLLVQLIATLVTIIKLLVLGPAWIIFRALRIAVKLLKIVILVLIWSICSVFQGVVALLILFGLLESRHGRAKPSGGDGDRQLLATSRREANLASVRSMGMAENGEHAGQGYIVFPGRPDRGAQNVGVVVGGMDGGPGAWQANTLWRDKLANLERCLARERALMSGYAGRP